MRKTPYVEFRSLVSAAALLIVSASHVHAQISLGNTTSSTFRGILSSNGTAYITDTGGARTTTIVGVEDQQTANTNSDADLVGDATTNPTFYIGFGSGNFSYTRIAPASLGNLTANVTTTAVSSTTSTEVIAFRVRLNGYKSNLSALNQMTYIGLAIDSNNSVDLLVGLDMVNQQSDKWSVVITGTGAAGNNSTANTSPSTTTVPYSGPDNGNQTNLNGAYFRYTVASSGNNNNVTLNSDSLANYQQTTTTNFSSQSDAFMTFAVPYADFVTAAQYILGSGVTFNSSTTFRLTASTSTQQNALNQDNMAPDNVSFNLSAPTNSSGAPIPEPSTFAGLILLLGPVAYVASRRRRVGDSARN